MAQIIETKVLDDISGEDGARAVRFSLDGKDYEIDLVEANANRLRDALMPFVSAARKAGGPQRIGQGARPAKRSEYDREQAQAIRSWAKQQKMMVSDRGRIPHEVVAAYEEAHAPTPAPGSKPKGKAKPKETHTRDKCEDLDNCPEHGAKPAPVVKFSGRKAG